MSTQTFTAMLEEEGKRLMVRLPFDPDAVWGKKERHHITGTLNGERVRGPLERVNGHWALTLGPAWRRDSSLEPGMQVELVLEAEGPQLDALADDIVAALHAEPEAAVFFGSLATFYRKGYLRWVDGARKPDARARRIAELVALLKAGKKERKQAG